MVNVCATPPLRALTKLGLGAPDALGQLLTFDELARDPRGPSLSIAMWAVFDDTAARNAAHAQWITFDAVPKLAFDHTAMVVATRSLLADKLARHDVHPRPHRTGVLGHRRRRHHRNNSTAAPHRANLNRDLAKNPNLTEAGTAAATGGRPQTLEMALLNLIRNPGATYRQWIAELSVTSDPGTGFSGGGYRAVARGIHRNAGRDRGDGFRISA